MRVLLDENLPRRLKEYLSQEITSGTVVECGWSGKKNGELLRLAEREFEIFLTLDRGIEFQQNIVGLDLAIILLQAPSNRLIDLLPLIEDLEIAIRSVVPGSMQRVTAN